MTSPFGRRLGRPYIVTLFIAFVLAYSQPHPATSKEGIERVASKGRPFGRSVRDPQGEGWSEDDGADRRQDPINAVT